MAKALEGKKIVIIGGTSGIGFAVAKEALQDRAAEVVVVSSQGINVDGAVDRLQKVVGGNCRPRRSGEGRSGRRIEPGRSQGSILSGSRWRNRPPCMD